MTNKKRKIEHVEKMDLQTFLDTKNLSRAERVYYERTYRALRDLRTYREWERSVLIAR